MSSCSTIARSRTVQYSLRSAIVEADGDQKAKGLASTSLRNSQIFISLCGQIATGTIYV